MCEADGIIGVSERASCPKTGAHPRIKSEDMLFGKRALRSDPRPVSLGKARRIEAWSQDYNHHHLYLKLGWLTPAATAPRCQQKEELNERSSGAFNGDRILSRIRGRWPHDYLRPPIPPCLVAVSSCASCVRQPCRCRDHRVCACRTGWTWRS